MTSMDATKKAAKEAILSKMNARNPIGFTHKERMASVLEGIGIRKDDAHLLLSAMDVNQAGEINHEELVSWIFKTEQGTSDGALESAVTLRLETMTGDLAAVLHMSLENTVWEVKGRLAEVTGISQEKQQLVLKDSALKNNAYLHMCGIHGPHAVLTLVRRATVPKLLEFEAAVHELDSISDAGDKDVFRMLHNLFQQHDLNEPILVPEGFNGNFEAGFDEESGGAWEDYDPEYSQLQRETADEANKEKEAIFKRFGPDEAMEDLGFETGAPALWHVVDMQIMVSPGTVWKAAKWMLSRGASPDVEWKGRSAAQLALQFGNTALLRHLSLAGAKPSLHDLLDVFPRNDELGFDGRSCSGLTLSALLEFLDLVLELAKSYPLEDREKAFVDGFDAEDCGVWRKARFLDLGGVTSDTAVLGWWADKQSDIKLLAASMDAAMQEAARLDPKATCFFNWPEDLRTRYDDFLNPLKQMLRDRREEEEEEGYGDEF